MPIINSKIRYAFGCLIFIIFLVALLVSCINSNNNAEALLQYGNVLIMLILSKTQIFVVQLNPTYISGNNIYYINGKILIQVV